jgi:hypothetical protein
MALHGRREQHALRMGWGWGPGRTMGMGKGLDIAGESFPDVARDR